jgi:hypothetical protein
MNPKFKGYIFAKKGPNVPNHLQFFRDIKRNNDLNIPDDQPIGVLWGIDPLLDFSHPFTGVMAQQIVAGKIGENQGFKVDLTKSKIKVINDREYGQMLLIEIYSV